MFDVEILVRMSTKAVSYEYNIQENTLCNHDCLFVLYWLYIKISWFIYICFKFVCRP